MGAASAKARVAPLQTEILAHLGCVHARTANDEVPPGCAAHMSPKCATRAGPSLVWVTERPSKEGSYELASSDDRGGHDGCFFVPATSEYEP
jgi:hypothetical protein